MPFSDPPTLRSSRREAGAGVTGIGTTGAGAETGVSAAGGATGGSTGATSGVGVSTGGGRLHRCGHRLRRGQRAQDGSDRGARVQAPGGGGLADKRGGGIHRRQQRPLELRGGGRRVRGQRERRGTRDVRRGHGRAVVEPVAVVRESGADAHARGAEVDGGRTVIGVRGGLVLAVVRGDAEMFGLRQRARVGRWESGRRPWRRCRRRRLERVRVGRDHGLEDARTSCKRGVDDPQTLLAGVVECGGDVAHEASARSSSARSGSDLGLRRDADDALVVGERGDRADDVRSVAADVLVDAVVREKVAAAGDLPGEVLVVGLHECVDDADGHARALAQLPGVRREDVAQAPHGGVVGVLSGVGNRKLMHAVEYIF